MRKKIAAILMAASLAACTLTACGMTAGGDMVSKKEWEAAFDRTLALKNYTLKAHISTLSNYEASSYGEEFMLTGKYEYSEAIYVNSDKIYAVAEETSSLSGVPNDVTAYENFRTTAYVAAYSEQKDSLIYCAVYNSYGGDVDEEYEDYKPEWVADKVPSMISVSTPLSGNNYTVDNLNEYTTICGLYTYFDYKDGYYYLSLTEGSEQKDVYITFRDGYISKLMLVGIEYTEGDNEVYMSKEVYEFSDINNTNVNPDPAALEAIEKYKN